jgi:hypothetical protein
MQCYAAAAAAAAAAALLPYLWHTKLLLQHNIAACKHHHNTSAGVPLQAAASERAARTPTPGSQSHRHCVGDLVDSLLQPAPGINIKNNLLGITGLHNLRAKTMGKEPAEASRPSTMECSTA